VFLGVLLLFVAESERKLCLRLQAKPALHSLRVTTFCVVARSGDAQRPRAAERSSLYASVCARSSFRQSLTWR